jgi:hypothetical protein
MVERSDAGSEVHRDGDHRLEDRLTRLRPKELREMAKRHGIEVLGIRRKADLVAALAASPAAQEILHELGGEAKEKKARLQEDLAATLSAIREAASMGAAVRFAEDAWKAAADALEEGDLDAAKEKLDRTAQRTTEARDRRIREIETTIATVSEHIARAHGVGADAPEAAQLLENARETLAAQEYQRADDFVERAERAAMQAQRMQIERALQLREDQMERAQAIIASCEPLLQEAESYDLQVAEVRTLLRQARDILAKGDYVAGLTFARNAQEAAYRLEAGVEEERRRRGILKPLPGVCGACGSTQLLFYEDGLGRCGLCGSEFRWREPFGVRERVRELLGT